MQHPKPRIGLALGSGSARGWSHIGIIRVLEEAGIAPDIVCGTSIGSLVGAAYADGQLDRLEEWVRGLTWHGVVGLLDFTVTGGLIVGEKLFGFIRTHFTDKDITTLGKAYGAVATELQTGREVWLREGSMLDAVRASVALPGLFTPARINGRLLVDGALVNPVPVSLCRAMGADIVIAVDLNSDLMGRHFQAPPLATTDAEASEPTGRAGPHGPGGAAGAAGTNGPAGVAASAGSAGVNESAAGADVVEPDEPAQAPQAPLPAALAAVWGKLPLGRGLGLGRHKDAASSELATPSIFEVLSLSLNIMQVRITRSRLAGEPSDILIRPRLGNFALMDFHRAGQAIKAGEEAARKALPELQELLGRR